MPASTLPAAKLPTIALPVVQNWSCHNCGGCCTEHLIEVTAEELLRIESQNWQPADGVPAGQPLFVWHAGPWWKKRYRLAHRADGGCVFLNEQGLCRIHAKFGEPAKPLPCRLYPYAFHPSSKGATLSLRFSCPSVVKNLGRAVKDQRVDLNDLARDVLPAGGRTYPAPALNRHGLVDWTLFNLLTQRLLDLLTDDTVPVILRVLRVLSWLPDLDQLRAKQLSPSQLGDLLDVFHEAALVSVRSRPSRAEISRTGALNFRLMCAIYARKDTVAQLSTGWSGRWKLLRAVLRFSSGRGLIPVLQPGFAPVPFEQLEGEWGPWPSEMEEIWSRYFEVKLRGHHFAGRAFYDRTWVDGVGQLLLVVPIVCWLARWLARSDARDRWTLDDFTRALALVDHHHGYSPLLGQRGPAARARQLWTSGDLSPLVVRYAT